MKKLLLAFLLSLSLSSCAVLQSKEVAVGCRVADATSTYYLIAQKGLTEANPLMKALIGLGWPAFFAVQAGVIWFWWTYWDDIGEDIQPIVTVASCLPVVNNAQYLGHVPE